MLPVPVPSTREWRRVDRYLLCDEIASGGIVIIDASAPAPGEFADSGRTAPGELDLGALESSTAASVSGQSSAVPEPCNVALLAFGAVSLLARRPRR